MMSLEHAEQIATKIIRLLFPGVVLCIEDGRIIEWSAVDDLDLNPIIEGIILVLTSD